MKLGVKLRIRVLKHKPLYFTQHNMNQSKNNKPLYFTNTLTTHQKFTSSLQLESVNLNNLREVENVNSLFQLRGKNKKVDVDKMVVGDEWLAREESEMDVGDGLGIGDGLFLSLSS
jgi:hypothetical protein